MRWTVATTAAIALCNPLGIVGLFGGPIVLAIAQGWAMRPYWPHYRWWGLATIIGGYCAIFLLVGLVLLSRWPVFVMVFVCGAIAAVPHTLVLRYYRQRGWPWWPLINAGILTVSLFWFMPDIINASIYGNSRVSWAWLAMATLTGLIGGSLKGLAVAQMLKPR